MDQPGEENAFTDSPAPVIRVDADHEYSSDSFISGRTCPVLHSSPAIADGLILLAGKKYLFRGGIAYPDGIHYLFFSVGVEAPGASKGAILDFSQFAFFTGVKGSDGAGGGLRYNNPIKLDA